MNSHILHAFALPLEVAGSQTLDFFRDVLRTSFMCKMNREFYSLGQACFYVLSFFSCLD
jgi:hypothetical protein